MARLLPYNSCGKNIHTLKLKLIKQIPCKYIIQTKIVAFRIFSTGSPWITNVRLTTRSYKRPPEKPPILKMPVTYSVSQ